MINKRNANQNTIAPQAKKKCPHSNCDDDGKCFRCGKNALENGIAYNPRVHKKLVCDKVVSVVKGKDLVGVYWKGTNGAGVLFETSPSKARKVVEIFNAKARA